MWRSQYSEEQIIGILKEAEAGKPIRELCREHGLTDQTYYRWKSKYGGLEVSEAGRLEYNALRPHSSLGYLSPEQFLASIANSQWSESAARTAWPPNQSASGAMLGGPES